MTEQSPFAPGTQVQWQSPDSTSGQRFNVMADCGGNLIVSAGGLLLTDYPQGSNAMAAGLVNTHNLTGNDVWFTNLVSPTPEETAFEQGGGGDINAAINALPTATAPLPWLPVVDRATVAFGSRCRRTARRHMHPKSVISCGRPSGREGSRT